MTDPLYFGAVEGGGTKFNCAIGDASGRLIETGRFLTTAPDETLGEVAAFFQDHAGRLPLAALGVGTFGPVDVNPASPTFGYITATPKPGWSNTDIAGRLGRILGVPVGFDTDVNGAAFGEGRWGAAQGLTDFVYITVGTGIGGGVIVAGGRVHGLVHPEVGHMRLPRNAQADPFGGVCPFHGDCLEGLASGPAMRARWGKPAETLPPDHPAWALEAHYLALAVANLVVTVSPQRVILGGGVMAQDQLFPLVRRETVRLLNGYVQSAEIIERIESYIVPPGLGAQAGVLGALALAIEAAGAPAGG